MNNISTDKKRKPDPWPRKYGAPWIGNRGLQYFGRIELIAELHRTTVYWSRHFQCSKEPRTVATASRRLRRKAPASFKGSVRQFARQAAAEGDKDAKEWLLNKGVRMAP